MEMANILIKRAKCTYNTSMFLGLNGGGDRDQNCKNCWAGLELGFKSLLAGLTGLHLLLQLFPILLIKLPNFVFMTVSLHEFWRPFTALAYHGEGINGFLNLLFDFYILYMLLPEFERKLSTPYIVLEFFLQAILYNLVLLAGYPIILAGIVEPTSFFGMGLVPVIFSFLWKKVAESPDEPTRFCFCPCLIPMKFLPLLFAIFYVFFGQPLPTVGVYCLVGYLQYMVLGKSLLRLPLRVYRRIEACLPEMIKEHKGYVRVAVVEQELRKVCLATCCNWQSNEGEHSALASVEVLGGGVAIGSSKEQTFRNYWMDKNQDNSDEDELHSKQRPGLDSDEHYGESSPGESPLSNIIEQLNEPQKDIIGANVQSDRQLRESMNK